MSRKVQAASVLSMVLLAAAGCKSKGNDKSKGTEGVEEAPEASAPASTKVTDPTPPKVAENVPALPPDTRD